jgi:hypothetical protein
MSTEHPPTCTWKSCPGWTIDWLGFVRPCGPCARFAQDEEAATAAREFIGSFEALPGEGAPEPCSQGCRGWAIFERGGEMPGFDIERCGDCGLFANDDEALAAAVKWLLEHLTHPERYAQKVVEDAGIAFDEMVGRTVARLEHGNTKGAHGDEPTVTLHFTDGTRHTLMLAADFAPGYDDTSDLATKRAGSEHEEDVVGGRARCGVCGWIDEADLENPTVRAWHGDSFTEEELDKGAPAVDRPRGSG